MKIWTTEEIERRTYGNLTTDEVSLRVYPPTIHPETCEEVHYVTGHIYAGKLAETIDSFGDDAAARKIGAAFLACWRQREQQVKENQKCNSEGA